MQTAIRSLNAMTIGELCMAAGVPSAIFGVFIWYFKRYIEKRDKVREAEARKREEKREVEIEEREKNTERLMMLIMQDCHATYILSEATAKAVQRIPDAKCNGDMTSALDKAESIQKKETEFLTDLGIKHVFGD